MEVEDLALRPKASTPDALNADNLSSSNWMIEALPSSPSRKRKASHIDQNIAVSSISSADDKGGNTPSGIFGAQNEVLLHLNHLGDHKAQISMAELRLAAEQTSTETIQTELPLTERSPLPDDTSQLTKPCMAIGRKDDLPASSPAHHEDYYAAAIGANTLEGNADDDKTSWRAIHSPSAQVPADDIVCGQEPTQCQNHVVVVSAEEGHMLSIRTKVQDAIRVYNSTPKNFPDDTRVFVISLRRGSREMYQNVSARPISSYASFRDKVIGKKNRVPVRWKGGPPSFFVQSPT